MDAVLLWSANTTVGSGDLLPSVGTEFGLRGTGTVLDQVATNAIDLGVADPFQIIQTKLSSGWSIAEDIGTGTNAIGNDSASGKGGLAYNSGNPFQVKGGIGASGSGRLRRVSVGRIRLTLQSVPHLPTRMPMLPSLRLTNSPSL